MAVAPPLGLDEADYEAIEAAVTETVRGRWFLAEFGRRNKLAETRQLLDAMTRLEAAVASSQVALQGSDPSIRLMIQRIKDIAARLGSLAADMRDAGVAELFPDAVEREARAVAGMMRGGSLAGSPMAGERKLNPTHVAPASRLPAVDAPPAAAQLGGGTLIPATDARLAVLSELDGMPLAEKIALFT